MAIDFFNNLTKFVLCMHILLAEEVYKDQLYDVQMVLSDFMCEAEILYEKKIMLSGFHEIIHLVKCSRDYGPLNVINSFQFEEINRKITRLIKGRDLMGEEFIKLFSIYQSLETFKSINVKNQDILEFLIEYGQFKTSNRKKRNQNKPPSYRINGEIDDQEHLALFKEFDPSIDQKKLFCSKSVCINGVVFTDSSNDSKFANHYIKINEKYGLIRKIVIYESSIFFIVQGIFNKIACLEYMVKGEPISFFCDLNISHLFN